MNITKINNQKYNQTFQSKIKISSNLKKSGEKLAAKSIINSAKFAVPIASIVAGLLHILHNRQINDARLETSAYGSILTGIISIPIIKNIYDKAQSKDDDQSNDIPS